MLLRTVRRRLFNGGALVGAHRQAIGRNYPLPKPCRNACHSVSYNALTCDAHLWLERQRCIPGPERGAVLSKRAKVITLPVVHQSAGNDRMILRLSQDSVFGTVRTMVENGWRVLTVVPDGQFSIITLARQKDALDDASPEAVS